MTRLGQVFEYRVHNINKSSHSQVLEVLEQIRDGFLPFGKSFINYDVNMAESSELPCSIERIICPPVSQIKYFISIRGKYNWPCVQVKQSFKVTAICEGKHQGRWMILGHTSDLVFSRNLYQ